MEPEKENEFLMFERMRQNSLRHQRAFRDQIINESRKLFEGSYSALEEEREAKQTIEIVEQPFRAAVDVLYPTQTGLQQKVKAALAKAANKARPPSREGQMQYSRRFQVAGWLNCIPEDFSRYVVMLKPAGVRVLLFFHNGKVVARDKHSYLHKQFFTEYAGKTASSTVLDAIYNPETQSYYVTDVIVWKGNYLCAEEALFRQNWIASNLPAVSAPIEVEGCMLTFRQCKLYENTRSNLIELYSKPAEYQKEGFVFIHPQSKYLFRNNEEVLCWKDANISKYPIDTEADGITISEEIKALGTISKSRGLYTIDRHKLWQFDESVDIQGATFCRFGFTRITVTKGEETGMVVEGEQETLEVRLEGFRVISFNTGLVKCLVDPLSKLVYQYRARHNPLRFEQLLGSLPK